MRRAIILCMKSCLSLLVASFLFACTSEEAPSPDGGTPSNAGQAAGDSYGASLSASETTAIHDLLKDKESFVGETLQVEGTVVGVCAMRGCWIEIGGEDGESIRFKVNDGEMVFPMAAKGSSVRAEGVWTKIVVPVEELRANEAKKAAEAGEEFDPQSISEPYIGWQLKGLGAVIDV